MPDSNSSSGRLPENQFVYRLMTAKCSYGSMSHPLNVAESGGGHGVLFGPEAQPLLNANDWRPGVNVIHFGDCTPRAQDMDTGQAIEKTGFSKFISGVVEFFTAQKCSPMIDQVWYGAEKKYAIDGAPVLLVKSMLFCKRGGIITIEAAQMNEESSGEAGKTPEQIEADIAQANAQVAASVDQALEEGRIDAETAQFMKDGYSEALNFANGDIELANQLFSDLASHSSLGGGAGEFASNEAQYDKFQLYLEHNDSPLANADSSAMKVRDGSGGGAGLGDAVSEVLVQNQEAAQSEEGTKKPASPIITTLLGGPA